MPERLRAPVLQVRRLGFAYPDQAAPFVDLCADLPTGVTLLHGEIGSGTTTLLRLLAGELLGSGDLIPHGRRFGDNPAACLQGVCALDPRDEAFDALTPARLMTAICSVERGQDEAACSTTWSTLAWQRILPSHRMDSPPARSERPGWRWR